MKQRNLNLSVVKPLVGKKEKVYGFEWTLPLPYLGHLFWDILTVQAHPLTDFLLFIK